jgi:hypothetical protein
MSLVITPTKNQKTVPVQINLDRMKSALSSDFVMIQISGYRKPLKHKAL